ncbi:MAG: beta-ketoacyl-[acyl-carrier-protein] synthase family protein [Desulfovibrionaceae bacterium]|nr:beta-ketoacyl-[acyl-carrier-protein] synthase family protein [Desulfovibrionaceae bacterium]
MPRMEPAAITGMGCVCALGADTGCAARGLGEGGRQLAPASALSPIALDYPFLAVPDMVWPEGRRTGWASDTLHLAGLAAREALGMAGLADGRGAAVLCGTTTGTALHFLDGYSVCRNGGAPGPDCQAYLDSDPALALAAALGADGPVLTLSNACTSGADAVGMGLDMLRCGMASRVLCGGADAMSLVSHTGFARLMLADTGPCRPFDAHRQGLNLGEGAAFLVLEHPAAARARGAEILGFVRGFGAHADAHHFTAPHPEGEGLAHSVTDALEQAGLKAGDLAFVNVHGTGTRENDRVEGRTLSRLLPGVPLWASKGLTGHTLGAAGAIEAVFTLLALRRGIVPKSAGFAEQDPDIGASPTMTDLPVSSPSALSTSLGFGGGNAALILSTEAGHD